ncbi:MAG: ribbon-helix-helix protein, CopG family [Thermoplasmata archaeon]|nr:ribbon-helix-helix protein, CopG family [Thermoplasmata archaeon]
MSDDTVTVSAKLPEGLRDGLDEIGEELGISNRSLLVRRALELYVERHATVGIPHEESDVGEERSGVSAERKAFVYLKRRQSPAKIRRKPRRRSHERRD